MIPEWRLQERERELDEVYAELLKEEVQKEQELKGCDVKPKAEITMTEPIKEEVQKVFEMKPRAMGKGKGCVKSKAERAGREHEEVQKVPERDKAVVKARGKGKGHVVSVKAVHLEGKDFHLVNL